MLTQENINVISNSKISERERRLSNFSADKFTLGDQCFSTVEGFIQGIKYSPSNPIRRAVFAMTGKEAKRHSLSTPPEYVEWDGQKIRYGSLEHHRLEAAAIFAKFDQSNEAQEALLATGDLPLMHDTGRPQSKNTSLPNPAFVKILEETRDAMFGEMGFNQMTTEELYVTAEVVQYARGTTDLKTMLEASPILLDNNR
jgi:predicted NAD-dependent protein-ADP-ribosyltransferase YbiA (DUF1768 family)